MYKDIVFNTCYTSRELERFCDGSHVCGWLLFVGTSPSQVDGTRSATWPQIHNEERCV